MKKIIRRSPIALTLLLSFCAHADLKSPCDNAKLAAKPGLYVPCDTPKNINIASITTANHKEHS